MKGLTFQVQIQVGDFFHVNLSTKDIYTVRVRQIGSAMFGGTFNLVTRVGLLLIFGT